jgi:FkbM family methyltransferase
MAPWESLVRTKVCRHGIFSYLPHDLFVGRSLDVYGEFSEHEVALFQQLLRPGAVVIEAGANIGALTVPIARAVCGAGRLIAYEPQAVLAALLARNVGANGLAQVEVRCAALGARPGSLRVPPLDYAATGNFGGVSLGADTGVDAPVDTIDGLDLARVDLIKIDVEGMELEVLHGADDLIARCRPMLHVENDRTDRSAALIAALLERRYVLWWHLSPLFSPDNHAGRADNIFPTAVSINLLCAPVERGMTVSGAYPVAGPDDTYRAAFARGAAR